MDNIHNLSAIDIDSLVRATKVKEWLAGHHLDYSAFKKLVKAGLVKAHKMGNGVNSPLCYSKCEMHYAFSLQRKGIADVNNIKKERT